MPLDSADFMLTLWCVYDRIRPQAARSCNASLETSCMLFLTRWLYVPKTCHNLQGSYSCKSQNWSKSIITVDLSNIRMAWWQDEPKWWNWWSSKLWTSIQRDHHQSWNLDIPNLQFPASNSSHPAQQHAAIYLLHNPEEPSRNFTSIPPVFLQETPQFSKSQNSPVFPLKYAGSWWNNAARWPGSSGQACGPRTQREPVAHNKLLVNAKHLNLSWQILHFAWHGNHKQNISKILPVTCKQHILPTRINLWVESCYTNGAICF